MKIEKFKTYEGDKVKAFFSVRTDDGFLISGFKLITTEKGTFVGFPSERAGAGYRQTVYGSKKSKEKVLTLVLAKRARLSGNTDNGAPAANWKPPIEKKFSFGDEY